MINLKCIVFILSYVVVNNEGSKHHAPAYSAYYNQSNLKNKSIKNIKFLYFFF